MWALRLGRCIMLPRPGLRELAQYEDSYRLCYVRGPEGIIVALAEQLS